MVTKGISHFRTGRHKNEVFSMMKNPLMLLILLLKGSTHGLLQQIQKCKSENEKQTFFCKTFKAKKINIPTTFISGIQGEDEHIL